MGLLHMRFQFLSMSYKLNIHAGFSFSKVCVHYFSWLCINGLRQEVADEERWRLMTQRRWKDFDVAIVRKSLEDRRKNKNALADNRRRSNLQPTQESGLVWASRNKSERWSGQRNLPTKLIKGSHASGFHINLARLFQDRRRVGVDIMEENHQWSCRWGIYTVPILSNNFFQYQMFYNQFFARPSQHKTLIFHFTGDSKHDCPPNQVRSSAKSSAQVSHFALYW